MSKNTLHSFSRHVLLLHEPQPIIAFDSWLKDHNTRSLSVPDLNKLKKEWDAYQQSDMTLEHRMIDTKMQIDLLNIRLDNKVRKPQVRLKMGPAQYYSKRSDTATGDWNEGFVFMISYHAQLFNTIEFDFYEKPHQHWPTIRHMGKAKLKISTLAGKTNDVFVTFLPIYEYRSHRLLPLDFQSTLLNIVDDPAMLSKKIGDLTLIGSVQIRIRYHFQQPMDRIMPPNKSVLHDDTLSDKDNVQQNNSQRTTFLLPDVALFHPLSTTTTTNTVLLDEQDVNDVFKDRLTNIMTAHIPASSSEQSLVSSSSSKNGEHVEIKCGNKIIHHRRNSLGGGKQNHMSWILHHLILPAKKSPNASSSSGRRFGFSQIDSDDTHQFNPDGSTSARKKAPHRIDSVNFGDRNFASQWMQDSFEDVALSHPLVDKLIGLVVSKQTQAMVRAIIKTANAFGQGFRVTGIQLLKSALLIQTFYQALPVVVAPKDIIGDLELIDNACHYFSFALVAYGWRGLCYLGAGGGTRSNRLAIIRYLHLYPEDLLGYEYALRKGASFQPSYYVALDRKKKAIVLSIRGTWSLYDAITDLICEYMPWKGGLVHSGMLASAQWFYTNIIPQLFRYIHHHTKELKSFIITGHSLGGGTASLLTMMVADHIEEIHDLACNPNFNMHCYNYAPTAVCSPNLGEKYKEYITSFVCQDDVVGRVSYGSAMKLKELVLDVVSAYSTLGGFNTTMTDPKVRNVCFDIISQCRDKLKNVVTDAMYPSLYIPGEIIHIQRSPGEKSKTIYSLHYINRDISNEMKLTKTCIEDHMITSYQNAFVGLKEQHLLD